MPTTDTTILAEAIEIVDAADRELTSSLPLIDDAVAVAVIAQELHNLRRMKLLLQQEMAAPADGNSQAQALLQMLDVFSRIVRIVYDYFTC